MLDKPIVFEMLYTQYLDHITIHLKNILLDIKIFPQNNVYQL